MSDKKEGASVDDRKYGFDPSGFEKAAEAAKYLDSSPNAEKAFKLALKEEELKIIKENKAIKEQEILFKKIEQEEKRKSMQMELEVTKEKSHYDDQLAKERIKYRLQREKEALQGNLRAQEESIITQEKLKQATIEKEHILKLKQDKERILNKYKVKYELEKENIDLTEKKIRITESEKRITNRLIAKDTLDLISDGVKSFFNNKVLFMKTLSALSISYIFIYACRTGINLVYKITSNRLTTPNLIRETSRISINNFYKNIIFPKKYTESKKDALDGIVLSKDVKDQLTIIGKSVKNRKKHFAPFRNLLLYGPPGTGKTLFAKQLAKRSGLEFAIMTGADVAPLGPMAVYELNKIFDWAELTRNGMVLFVDETDAFLRRRAADELISENLRSAINTFLYRTGSPSNKIMVILATNCPEALDEAVQDRIDEIVFLDRPSTPERLSILYLYLLQYCEMNHISRETKSKFRSLFFKNKKINAEGLTDEYMNEVAVKTEGFSGRELNKLVVSWYDEVVAKEIPVLNKEIANLVLDRHIEQNKTKNKWNFIQKNYFDKLHSNKL